MHYFVIFLAIIFTSPAIAANINYYSPSNPKAVAEEPKIDKDSGNKILQITPIDSCFSKLSEEEVNNIKRHYIKPYKECLKRVAKKQRESKTLNFNKSQEKPEADATKGKEKPAKK